jgi:TatD DNase family protein
MKIIDAHCHLEQEKFPDLPGVVERARAAGLVHAIVVGQLQRPGDFGNAMEVASKHPDFFTPTMGIHPHDAAMASLSDIDELERLCSLPNVAAVGETGLDFYYDNSPRPLQEEMLRRHCAIARRLGKPLVVHVRDAHRECHSILREEKVERGMIHCFTGDTQAARDYLELGFYISVSGIVSYQKSEGLKEAVVYVPLSRLMVETDSPYLAPIPYRGKRNEPGWVVEVARKIAELKRLELYEVSSQTARNTVELFSLGLELG